LIGIAALSVGLRVGLLTRVQAPTVFVDELAYQRLAQSLGLDGRFALFNRPGVPYPPLYSAVLAPIYALAASAPTAYGWIKVVNALLMSLAIFPVYKISRFVLPRRSSLLVAALSAVAPLMNYTAFVMSENLAYPLFLVSIWSMLATLSRPSVRADALVLVSIAAVTAARIQLIALFPAALTAVVFAGVLERRRSDQGLARWVARALKQHWLLVGSGAAVCAVVGIRALAGRGIFSLTGAYGNVGESGVPNPWRLLELSVEHLAGLDLAVGVFPFVGTLVAAYAFLRNRSRADHVAFASVAVAVTSWLILEVAVFADFLAREHQGNLPRIYERYLFYVVPFFLIALIATLRLPESRASARIYLAATVPAALLPAVIPFHRVINISSVVDSFGLQLLARAVGDKLVPIPHVTLAALWISATFALVYVVVRGRTRAVVVFVLLVFILISGAVRTRIESAGAAGRSLLPSHRDWVDRTKPTGDVILITGAGPPAPALETAFNNLSIARVYYICNRAFGGEFGEQRISIDETGRLRDQSGYVSAPYAVVPAALGLRGRVVARNTRGHQVMLAPVNGRFSLSPARRANPSCS
jgi:hypothetical protein